MTRTTCSGRRQLLSGCCPGCGGGYNKGTIEKVEPGHIRRGFFIKERN